MSVSFNTPSTPCRRLEALPRPRFDQSWTHHRASAQARLPRRALFTRAATQQDNIDRIDQNCTGSCYESADRPLSGTRPPPIPVTDVILFQAFTWTSSKQPGNKWFQTLKGQIPELIKSGATHVWLPPVSKSVSPEGYLPGQLYDLQSKYGNKQDIIELNTALLTSGLRPVCDIVINHRTAQEQNGGVWNQFRDDIDHPGRLIDWGPEVITCNDPDYNGKGSRDTGENFDPAPDLDHANENVRLGLIDWMNWLKNYIGFEGWRFDFVKGYAAKYTKEYVEKTVGGINSGGGFCVGENFVDLEWDNSTLKYNQDAARQNLCDWAKEADCTVFDFVTKGILQEAVKNVEYDRLKDAKGNPSGMLGWWGSMAVTFIDNHDTGSTQQHWPFPKDKVLQGYAYIMTHPGIPCIFYQHYFDWNLNKEIDAMVALRKRAGIRADSKIEILAAKSDMYVARISKRVTVKLGPRFDMPGDVVPKESDGWKLALSGSDWAIWERE